MPLQRIVKNRQPAYRWGNSGKAYSYTPNNVRSRELAKQKALKQGRAEHARKGGMLKIGSKDYIVNTNAQKLKLIKMGMNPDDIIVKKKVIKKPTLQPHPPINHPPLIRSPLVKRPKHPLGGKLKQSIVSWVHLHQHTQAVLFSKRMSNAKIKKFLNHSKLKPTSIRQTKNYIRVRITEPNKLKFKYRIFQLNSNPNIKLVLQYPKKEKVSTGYAY